MENDNHNNQSSIYGIEVELLKPDSFLILKETLTRIGIPSRKDNTLYQSVHILHKAGRYYITHFKTLFILDGKENTITIEDIRRRNTIAKMVQGWGLCKIISPIDDGDCSPMCEIRIVPHKDKKNWNLVPKYKLGKKKTSL